MDRVISLIIGLFVIIVRIYCFHLQLIIVMNVKYWNCIDILAMVSLRCNSYFL